MSTMFEKSGTRKKSWNSVSKVVCFRVFVSRYRNMLLHRNASERERNESESRGIEWESPWVDKRKVIETLVILLLLACCPDIEHLFAHLNHLEREFICAYGHSRVLLAIFTALVEVPSFCFNPFEPMTSLSKENHSMIERSMYIRIFFK